MRDPTDSQGLGSLFDTSDFPPRWNCGDWTPLHGWIHITADLLIFGAYFAIPICILLYTRRKPHTSLPLLGGLFAVFILSCGLVHLVEATLFWRPWYRFSALLKVTTALASIATVIALVKFLPAALKLPELPELNKRLTAEVERRAQVEEELRRRNRDLDDFASVASHDLKAPLRGIQSLAEWVEEDAGGTLPPKSVEHLHKLRGRAARMQGMLEGLLRYYRMGNDSEVASLTLHDLAAEMGTYLNAEGKARIEIGPLPTIEAPRSPVEMIFQNLIGNALKHSDVDEPHLQISGEIVDNMATLDFRDDGPGISDKHRERIFNLFTTLRPQDEFEASGMGLALVRRAATNLGGSIELMPSEERGAHFRVRLPLLPHREPSAALQ